MDPEKRTLASHSTEVKTTDFSRDPVVGIQRGQTMLTNHDMEAQISPQHVLFCRMIGMPHNYEESVAPSIWKVRNKNKKLKGLYPHVRAAYQWHTFQYWLVATVSNSLLWLQIIFGAALTALGGTKSDKVSIAIILLGALQTVFGGFITYFKSRNQPNRARQFRISLSRVLEAIEHAEAMLRDPAYVPPVYVPHPASMLGGPIAAVARGSLTPEDGVTIAGVEGLVLRLTDMYTEAVREATDNYPDFWMVNKSNNNEHVQTAVMKDMLDQLKAHGAILTNPNTNVNTSGGSTASTSGSSTAQNTSVQSGSTGANSRPAAGLPGQGAV